MDFSRVFANFEINFPVQIRITLTLQLVAL